jgi:hypothetical protein
MVFRLPKNNEKYLWTRHVFEKMRYYSISENRVKRIIRFPKRTEEGIVPGTVAVMQPAGTKRYQEIWVMYKLAKRRANPKSEILNPKQRQIKIITAWRYPGKSPERDPIPEEIINEVRNLLL